jgi:diacylglycerol kinase family enzyme
LIPRVEAALAGAGFAVEPAPTTGAGSATALARAAAVRGIEVVFALGGDGTVREAAASLLGTETALGILPAGTTNVVARAFGLPRSPLAAARVAGEWKERSIDAGLCGEQPFLMQATAGLDAVIMAATSGVAKGRWGRAAVGVRGLREWQRYDWPELQIEADGAATSATFAAVCNLAEYGGSFKVAPAARPDDRQLDLVLFHGRGRAAYLSWAIDLAAGRHAIRADVEIRTVQEVRFLGPSSARAQLDGDALELPFPLVIRLAPERLRLLVPLLDSAPRGTPKA